MKACIRMLRARPYELAEEPDPKSGVSPEVSPNDDGVDNEDDFYNPNLYTETLRALMHDVETNYFYSMKLSITKQNI